MTNFNNLVLGNMLIGTMADMCTNISPYVSGWLSDQVYTHADTENKDPHQCEHTYPLFLFMHCHFMNTLQWNVNPSKLLLTFLVDDHLTELYET